MFPVGGVRRKKNGVVAVRMTRKEKTKKTREWEGTTTVDPTWALEAP